MSRADRYRLLALQRRRNGSIQMLSNVMRRKKGNAKLNLQLHFQPRYLPPLLGQVPTSKNRMKAGLMNLTLSQGQFLQWTDESYWKFARRCNKDLSKPDFLLGTQGPGSYFRKPDESWLDELETLSRSASTTDRQELLEVAHRCIGGVSKPDLHLGMCK